MKKTLVILFICLIFISPSIISAKTNDEFINHVVSIIESDCQGEDIKFNYLAGNYTDKLLWSYKILEKDPLLLITEINSYNKLIFTDFSAGNYMGSGINGKEIIKCGDTWLDISGDDYYWNHKLIRLPREGDIYETNINQIGFLNFFNNININITLKIIFTLSIVLNITLSFGIYFIIKHYKKKFKNTKSQ